MKLSKVQQDLYDTFYESTNNDGVLENKTSLLVGLAASMATNCSPCTSYYLKMCKHSNVSKAEIQATLAKVMAVAAGQKRLQAKAVMDDMSLSLDDYT